jgi:hypothetical protein
MHAPAHAVVLSIDEKSQIQALDRTQPGLPLKPDKCGTMTHDYKRHGTTTLFAALNVLDGVVLGHAEAHLSRVRPSAAAINRYLKNTIAIQSPSSGQARTRHPRKAQNPAQTSIY